MWRGPFVSIPTPCRCSSSRLMVRFDPARPDPIRTDPAPSNHDAPRQWYCDFSRLGTFMMHSDSCAVA
eukprot:7871208-Pyramimonas_sp.AAC.1